MTTATIPPGVHGGVTANSVVTTSGRMTVDGRDHDIDGNVIAGQGSLGISTASLLRQRGNSKVGGTASTLDYAPSKTPPASIIEENASYTFPSTPDAVFEQTEGTLKSIAQSGADGGQYVTDPATLTFPLSGVTYVELADGGTWNGVSFGANSGCSQPGRCSQGVLVVHNSAGNAVIKNLNSGAFIGLIIADDIDKIHTTILGAAITLTVSPSGNCIGNGNGEILYGSEALLDASTALAGSGGSMTIASWLE